LFDDCDNGFVSDLFGVIIVYRINWQC